MPTELILPAVGSMVVLMQTPALFALWIVMKEIKWEDVQ